MTEERRASPSGDEGLTVLLQFLSIPVFLVALWAGMNLFAESTNLVAVGTVTTRQEEILFSGDEWHRAFEVSYSYQVPDAGTVSDTSFVDREVYDHLSPRASVRIHYSRWKLMRLVKGLGSYIEGTSWGSRLPGGAWQAWDWGESAALLVAILLGFIAYRLRSLKLGIVAALSAGTAYPLFLLLAGGLLIFPFLFWAWRRHPGKG